MQIFPGNKLPEVNPLYSISDQWWEAQPLTEDLRGTAGNRSLYFIYNTECTNMYLSQRKLNYKNWNKTESSVISSRIFLLRLLHILNEECRQNSGATHLYSFLFTAACQTTGPVLLNFMELNTAACLVFIPLSCLRSVKPKTLLFVCPTAPPTDGKLYETLCYSNWRDSSINVIIIQFLSLSILYYYFFRGTWVLFLHHLFSMCHPFKISTPPLFKHISCDFINVFLIKMNHFHTDAGIHQNAVNFTSVKLFSGPLDKCINCLLIVKTRLLAYSCFVNG